MFPGHEDEFMKRLQNDLVCVICNKQFSSSPELDIHQHKLHSKRDLSSALIQLQMFLIQAENIIKSFRSRQEKQQGNNCNNKNQHFLYNCMKVSHLDVLLNKSSELTHNSNDRNPIKIDGEEICDDGSFQVTIPNLDA